MVSLEHFLNHCIHDKLFGCSEVQWETHGEPQSQQCTEADRGEINEWVEFLTTSSFNFSLDQVRFAAAAIGNEEMACPANDREVANYNREITNQIVVD